VRQLLIMMKFDNLDLREVFCRLNASFIIRIAPKQSSVQSALLCILFGSSESYCLSASVKPVVPITARTPAPNTTRRLSITSSGRVKSMKMSV
jgi:hypothetical protein